MGYVVWLAAVGRRLAPGSNTMDPVYKHLVTVNAMKNIITYTSTLARVSSVSYHCEEQTQESILDRILSKGPIITITAKPKKPVQISLNQRVSIHLCFSSLCMFNTDIFKSLND